VPELVDIAVADNGQPPGGFVVARRGIDDILVALLAQRLVQ
jgi:hypothetical protein